MILTVVGAGYVGLVCGVGFAKMGHQVTLIDIDTEKVDMVNQGRAPIHEAGLDAPLRDLVPSQLRAVSTLDSDSIANADAIFLCVQSSTADCEDMDLTHIERAAGEIGLALRNGSGYPVVVVKSTVSPGTTAKRVVPILEESSGKRAGMDFAVMSNPEFLREGNALADFLCPDRIVIGGTDRRGRAVLGELYRDFGAPLIFVDHTTAEVIKCACNAFLAAKVSFINEVGNICKALGVDAYEVAEAMGSDPRISPHFLKAGIGFGGSCLPKDTRSLCMVARGLGYEPVLLESVLQVNDNQPLRLVELADRKMGGLDGKKVAVLGLAFKAGTDDTRKSPAIEVTKTLCQRGARVMVYDALGEERAKGVLQDSVVYCPSAVEAISQAEVVFVLTDSDEFGDAGLYTGKVVIDGRRVLDAGARDGLDYEGICW